MNLLGYESTIKRSCMIWEHSTQCVVGNNVKCVFTFVATKKEYLQAYIIKFSLSPTSTLPVCVAASSGMNRKKHPVLRRFRQ